jgi:hypothetical protein
MHSYDASRPLIVDGHRVQVLRLCLPASRGSASSERAAAPRGWASSTTTTRCGSLHQPSSDRGQRRQRAHPRRRHCIGTESVVLRVGAVSCMAVDVSL